MDLKLFTCISLLLCLSATADCQTKAARDSMPPHKNIIRISLMQPLLFGSKNLVLGYERVLNPHQSISINAGLISLPKIVSIDLDSLSVTKETKGSGYNVSMDYRFYLQKENKYLAPRGVYIGPYAFIYSFDRNNDWIYEHKGSSTSFDTEMKLRVFGAGFQLGYQFIFWKRLALDLVLIGPGLARYSYETKLNGELDIDEESDVVEALKAWVDEKFPGSDIVWGDKEVNADGRANTTSIGYRYMIHLGFNF